MAQLDLDMPIGALNNAIKKLRGLAKIKIKARKDHVHAKSLGNERTTQMANDHRKESEMRFTEQLAELGAIILVEEAKDDTTL